MKKTYIAPEALVVSLTMNTPVLNVGSIHDEEGAGQCAKEEFGPSGASIGNGKSVWDEDW